MRNAIKIYEDNKELFEKYNEGTLETFKELHRENLFAILDNEFFEKEPEFDSLLEAYVRKNESVFGD
jgi:hypothetical protein